MLLDYRTNTALQWQAANGSIANVSYYTERPKLLLDADGTPTHLYGTVYSPVEGDGTHVGAGNSS